LTGYFVAKGSWYKTVITSQAMMISAGTAMTTTATILCFRKILRLFKAFLFDMATTNSRCYLAFLLPKVHPARQYNRPPLSFAGNSAECRMDVRFLPIGMNLYFP
jgi:hypothetical protein